MSGCIRKAALGLIHLSDAAKGSFLALLKRYIGLGFYAPIHKSIRANLPISKRIYYRRAERISLNDFLENNKEKCIVCVLGHYIFVNRGDYYSYFDNEDDVVVCVWYIDTDLIKLRKEAKTKTTKRKEN